MAEVSIGTAKTNKKLNGRSRFTVGQREEGKKMQEASGEEIRSRSHWRSKSLQMCASSTCAPIPLVRMLSSSIALHLAEAVDGR